MGPKKITMAQYRKKKCELLKDFRSTETTHLTPREKNRIVRSYVAGSMSAFMMYRKVVG